MTNIAEYIELTIETEPDLLSQAAFDYLEANIVGWEPNEGNLEVWLITGLAQMAAQLAEVAIDVPPAIFRYFGSVLANLPPLASAPATVTSTWTMIDNLGYTIPEGTQVAIPAAGDSLLTFETQNEVTISPGSTTTAAGAIILSAIEDGSEGNGFSGPPVLLDILAFVSSVAIVGFTTGGVDPEEDDAYLDRLAGALQLQAPRPIVADDFAAMALSVNVGGRAVSIDLYSPINGLYTNERTVTTFIADADGEVVSGAVKTAVTDLLVAQREVNFQVYVQDPTYTIIEIKATVMAYPTFDSAALLAEVNTALADYLSPANWGQPAFGEARAWLNATKVRKTEIIEVLNSVEGVNYVTADPELRVQLGAWGSTADITLSGAAPLTRSGTHAITVTTP